MPGAQIGRAHRGTRKEGQGARGFGTPARAGESVEEGEAILLCSDGLVNEVTDQEIFEEYQKGGTPQEICTRLLDRTLRCGAPDNVTIVLAEV